MIGSLPNKDGRGTEYMSSNVSKKFFNKLTNLQKYNWVVLPGASEEDEILTKNNPTIVWLHVPTLYAPDFITKYFYNYELTKNIKAYIVQSKFHKNDVVNNFGVDANKVFILNNAFDPVPYVEKSNDHVNFIYVSQESRGLDILLEAFSRIEDSNLSLTVHGCGCSDCLTDVDINRYLDDKRIKFVGRTSREEYILNLQKANIFAYPCKFEETAGIALMEAMSAGVKIISTDLGAVPETTLGFAKIIKHFPREIYKQNAKKQKYVNIFYKQMKKAIKQIRLNKFNPAPQIVAINNRFNWNVIEKQWIDFNSAM